MRHKSARSARQAAYSIRNTNLGTVSTKPPKKQKTILEFALIDQDEIILMDPRDIIPEHHIFENMVHNPTFRDKNIRCDYVGLIYSQKKKLYMYLAINDDYTCHILFKDKDVYKLPGIAAGKIDFDDMNPDFHITFNANRLMNSVYDTVNDLTDNPIHIYRTSELFKR